MGRGAAVSAAIISVLVLLAIIPGLARSSCSMSGKGLEPPSRKHLLGTDPVGRDALCELVLGIRASVEAAFAALAVSLVVLFVSLTAGVSRLVAGIIDYTAALAAGLPRMSLLMVLALVTRLSPAEIGAMIGFLATLQGARAAATRAKQIAKNLYIEAARAIGAPRHRLVLRHIAPNAWNSIASYASIAAAAAVYAEAGLSMLGLGNPGEPSIGKLASLVLLTPGAVMTLTGLTQLLAALAAISAIALAMHLAIEQLGK